MMNFNLTNEIFSDISKLLDFFIENKILNEYKSCNKCSGMMNLKIQKMNKKTTILYRCLNENCRKRNSITRSNLNINELVHIIYLLLNSVNYKQLNNFYGISDATILSIKKNY
ncbi:hypothetical protein DMUE_6096 [Dictyocoela muelleri]|nr:hypothetical protein DMUE_6096 [Dictyocoela muelleri]